MPAVNQAAQTADEIIQFSIYDLAGKAFKAWAVSQLPFLGWPVFSVLFDWAVGLVLGPFYKFLAQVSTFTIIDLQTDVEKSNYLKAETAFRAVHLSGNQEAINAATANFKKAIDPLISWDGSAVP